MGIYVGGTTSTNHIGDYEEGSWSPVLADASSGGNTYTTGVVTARYTKIGDLVHAGAHCRSLGYTTAGGNSVNMNSNNQIYIRNFPFRTNGMEQVAAFCRLTYFNNIDNTQFGTHIHFDQNVTWCKLAKMDDNIFGGEVPVKWGHMVAVYGYFSLNINVSYRTDQ